MNIFLYDNHESLSQKLADSIWGRIDTTEAFHLGISTGFSPLKAYQIIGQRIQNQQKVFESLQISQIDEWSNLDIQNPHSCAYFVKNKIQNSWLLADSQINYIQGHLSEKDEAFNSLKLYFQHNPFHLLILGLGKNGHLALNEPGSLKSDGFRIVDLDISSQQHQMLSNSLVQPTKGITIGIQEILSADAILLIVSGDNKKEAYQNFKQKIDPILCPASYLHQHPNITIMVNKSVT